MDRFNFKDCPLIELFHKIGIGKNHQITKNYGADDNDDGDDYFGGDFVGWVKPD